MDVPRTAAPRRSGGGFRVRVAPWLLAAAALGPAAGCGAGAGPQPVSGAVTLNGRPLDGGDIRFSPESGDGLPVGSPIRAGRYRLPNPPGLAPGRYRVSITSRGGSGVLTDEPPDAHLGTPADKERVPARYNDQTTLRAEVTAGGSNTFDFDLTSDRDPARPRTKGP